MAETGQGPGVRTARALAIEASATTAAAKVPGLAWVVPVAKAAQDIRAAQVHAVAEAGVSAAAVVAEAARGGGNPPPDRC
jgi:hypothetical protein